MATENILMAAVGAGGDRQDSARAHPPAQPGGGRRVVKQHGKPNDLLQRLAGDPAFAGIDLQAALDPARFVGRAPEQVDEFIAEVIEPLRAKYANQTQLSVELKV